MAFTRLGTIGNYEIICRGASFRPYICAYNYDEKTESWQQGHYCQTFEDACKYALGLHSSISGQRLNEIATDAINYINMIDGGLEYFNEEYYTEITEEERKYFLGLED